MLGGLWITVLTGVLASTGCGRIGFDENVSNCTSLAAGSVEPVYPAAAGWNDYVRRDRPRDPTYSQSGVPCDGTETGTHAACVHAGEQRKLLLPCLASCAGVRARDLLDAFVWTCDETDGTPTVYATGLREGVGLKRLVSETSWNENSVIVQLPDGSEVTTAPARWWNNPVVALPDNSGGAEITLTESTTIYTLAASRSTAGYRLGADRSALVVLPGASLSYNGTSSACTTTAESCMVRAAGNNFLWLEGDFERGARYQIHFDGVRFSQVRGVRSALADARGIMLYRSSSCLLLDIAVDNAPHHSIELAESHDNVLSRVKVIGGGRSGAQGLAGLFFAGSLRNVVSRAVLANNSDYGALVYSGSDENTFTHVTAGNNSYAGIDVVSNRCTIVQVLGLNSPVGVGIRGSDNTAAQVAAAYCAAGVDIRDTSTGNILRYNLVVGGNFQDCTLSDSAGVPNGSCPAGFSITAGLDASSSLRYKVVSDDMANLSDTNGAAASAGAITDWSRFDTAYRGWGADGAPFPDTTNLGICNTACRIWDWRLAADATPLLVRDATGAQETTVFAPDEPCPPSVHGDMVVQDAIGNEFLVNALELLGDGRGDEDTLCESNEACVHSRYFGAHQGETGLVSPGTCLFEDGIVSAVQMHGY